MERFLFRTKSCDNARNCLAKSKEGSREYINKIGAGESDGIMHYLFGLYLISSLPIYFQKSNTATSSLSHQSQDSKAQSIKSIKSKKSKKSKKNHSITDIQYTRVITLTITIIDITIVTQISSATMANTMATPVRHPLHPHLEYVGRLIPTQDYNSPIFHPRRSPLWDATLTRRPVRTLFRSKLGEDLFLGSTPDPDGSYDPRVGTIGSGRPSPKDNSTADLTNRLVDSDMCSHSHHPIGAIAHANNNASVPSEDKAADDATTGSDNLVASPGRKVTFDLATPVASHSTTEEEKAIWRAKAHGEIQGEARFGRLLDTAMNLFWEVFGMLTSCGCFDDMEEEDV